MEGGKTEWIDKEKMGERLMVRTPDSSRTCETVGGREL